MPPSDLLALAAWPVVVEDGGRSLVDAEVIRSFERANELAAQIRRLRGERQVKPKQRLTLHVESAVQELIETCDGFVETLAGIGVVVPLVGVELPAVSSSIAFEGTQVVVSDLVATVDVDAEKARLDKVIADLSKQIANFEGRLANEKYVQNAKPELVQETRDQLAATQADLAVARSGRSSLG